MTGGHHLGRGPDLPAENLSCLHQTAHCLLAVPSQTDADAALAAVQALQPGQGLQALQGHLHQP